MCFCCCLKNKFDQMMNNFYAKKIYIDFLQYAHSYAIENKNINLPATKLVSFPDLENKFGYGKDEVKIACKKLVDCGFIKDIKGSSNISVTPEGEEFLKNFHIFTTKSALARFTDNYQTNLIGLVAIVGLLISLIHLL